MDDSEHNLWHRIKTLNDQQAMGDILAKYKESAVIVARQAHAKLPYFVSQSDIIDYSLSGLAEAVLRFDPSKGIQFWTFARPRCLGNICDELRGLMWFGRSKHPPQIISLERRIPNHRHQDEQTLYEVIASRQADPVQIAEENDFQEYCRQRAEAMRLAESAKIVEVARPVRKKYPVKEKAVAPKCKHNGCNRKPEFGGFCKRHGFFVTYRVRTKGCCVDGCGKQVFTRGRCRQHYYSAV